MGNDSYIKFNHITKKFPGVVALNDVSFSIKKGEVHAILGENGAGKSTLLNILHGVYSATSGNVEIDGRPVKFTSTYDAITQGVIKVHQEVEVVENLTVGQNIALGFESLKAGFLDYKEIYKKCDSILKELGCSIRSSDSIKGLGVGDLQMIAIAKSLYFDSNVVSFDEPTSALSEPEIERLFKIIHSMKEKGITILFISHKLDELFKICDRVTIMRDGQYVDTFNMKDITESDLIHAMVGRDVSNYAKRCMPSCVERDKVVFEAKHLKGETFQDISFKLYKGEILGFSGLVGARRTEVMRAIFGRDPLYGGEINVNGKKAVIHSTEDAMKYGIGLISEDRKREGFIPTMSNNRNVSTPSMKRFSRGMFKFLDEAQMRKEFSKFADLVQLNNRDPEYKTVNMSGGNQQKVIVAKWLESNANILIFDEPTKGVDVGAKAEIYKLMEEFVANGNSIIMVSSELPEVIGMSDRVIVMREGVITGELTDRKDFTEVNLLSHAMGDSKDDKE
ncbi:sugar ABC transporter ATP-binding protein [Porcincola intestinalis]|uniref:sugar ABC transporter ATP-binding protein n=1 Tax=Porcincola intestinalis TaxID=2606632 RepID=UPI0023F150B0|nr:sugar ABC transporter ATP-binding protein [Porcincola intestinalis]MCI6767134.1 sugar ABC transporter ATP-binding protein [Lachnospiraceae bacterium]MDD7061213.1 sugar ABC transporter ATP-binding protein [Porcincola intestinalis]MDY5283590.1 sugar ABC transporter ATP-binding protein [Porcincola intestinalis]